MRGPVNVLLVEDCEDDFMLFGEMLRSIENVSIDVSWARTYEAGLDALARPHDVGFVDYRLGARDGLNLIEAILGRGHRAPVIILTGQGDHEVDLRAMKVGASDYLVKGEMTASLLERSMRYAIERKRSEGSLKDSERKLEHSVSLLKATLESTADGILVTDRAGEIVNLNQRFKALWRLPETAGIAEIRRDLGSVLDQLKDPEAYTARVLQQRTQPEAEGADIIEFKDGRVFERHPRPQWSKGEIVGTVWSFRDITEQRHMQTTLAASDRRSKATRASSGKCS
jgi:FixJ family two-component response regulator